MIPRGRAPAGFTLVEMLVVLAILGFTMGLVASNGPTRSATLEMDAVAAQIVQSIRVARSMAIAGNGPVRFTVDQAANSIQVGNHRPLFLPADTRVLMTSVTADGVKRARRTIDFHGDGSATGGVIELEGGQRRVRIAVDWLTGRVTSRQIN